MNENHVPIERIIGKLDGYFDKNDYDGALRHLSYWKNEAESLSDKRGELTINSELMGLYRKLSKKSEAIAAAERAIALLKETEQERTATAGTIFVNAATVFNAFGYQERSLELFMKAKETYEPILSENDARLGALYNNCALTLVALKRYDEAESYYERAIAVMRSAADGALDEAITHLNLANLYEAKFGIEEAIDRIEERLSAAAALLDGFEKRDGYYAFVCEKCANTFGYYGLVEYAEALKNRAEEIYERA